MAQVFVVTGVRYYDYQIIAETEEEAYTIWSETGTNQSASVSEEEYGGTTEFEWNDYLSCSTQCVMVIGDFTECMDICQAETTITEVR